MDRNPTNEVTCSIAQDSPFRSEADPNSHLNDSTSIDYSWCPIPHRSTKTCEEKGLSKGLQLTSQELKAKAKILSG